MSTTQTPLAGTYTADPVHSSFGFAVSYQGVSVYRGTLTDVSARLENGRLEGTAKVESISIVSPEQFRAHVLGPEFFDAANHPEVSFEAGSLRRDGDGVTVDGVLEIKGNRAPITLAGKITEPVSDPWGGRKLGLSLAGSVDKNAVGLTWNAPLPEGGSMLADEVELSASLVFVPAPEA
jgi:polyisoprenoid-binding protein YceI